MIDLDCVKCTPEFLKGRFETDPKKRTGSEEEQEKVDALLNRIRSRVQEGMARNLCDWKWVYAIDKALDTPWRQFYPKLFDSFQSGDLKTCCSVLQGLNLGNLVSKKVVDGKDEYSINEENFLILVGLCTSYLKARWAKLVNDRRLSPLLKYEPSKPTMEKRAKCEVLTDRVQVMADQYAYFDVQKQAIFKMLAYSYAIRFIKEEWHVEEQEKYADAEDVKRKGKNEDGTNKIKVGDKITVIVKEGLRYDNPKPDHIYRDLAHELYTINSDSGLTFGGHWKIVRFRDLKNSGFWNDDKIALGNGTNPLVDYSSDFFQVYDNVIKVAPPCRPDAMPTLASSTSPNTNLESALANQWYGTDHMDQGTLVTYHFEKLTPKDDGLGEYAHPLWFRFVLAGDGCTVLWAAQLPGNPMVYDGYDADESRVKNASLVMEILPYQYQFETALSQIILSNRQNLTNLTLLNTDVLDEHTDWVKEIAGWGTTIWKKLNIIPASFKRLTKLFGSNAARTQQDMGVSLGLPKANIQEQIAVAQFILATLERALGMSNQEIAQTASHEISATETRNLAAATTSRLTFTGTAVDIGRDAWKRQLYVYLMAFGDDDFYGHIPADNPITNEQLTAIGFTFVDNDEKDSKEKYRRVHAKKSQLALPLYEFASTRDGDDRTNDSAIATVMATLIRDLINNPMTAAAIGPEQAIEWANAVGYFAGLPRDLKLRFTGKTPEQEQAQAQEQLKQVIEITLAAVDQKLIKALTPLLEEIKALKMEVAILMRYTGLAPAPGAGGPPIGNGAPPPMAVPPMAVPPERMMAPPEQMPPPVPGQMMA